MSWLSKTLNSSIGRKIVMAMTGLFLCSFLVVHLSGNFLLFKDDGGEAFNAYSHFMGSNGLIRIIEIALFAGFLLHMYQGIYLAYQNKKARPDDYAINSRNKNSSFLSRFMFWSGSLVFVFLALHLNTFFVQHKVIGTDAPMYESVQEAFANPIYAAFYIVAMALLAFHLMHGFQSAFQTLGLNNKKYTPAIKIFGWIFSIAISLGFAAMPVFFYLKSLNGGN